MWLSFVIILPFYLIALLPLECEDLTDSIECEQVTFKTAFGTNVHVEAEISYPEFPGISNLIKYVNQSLKEDSHLHYNQFVQEMRIPQESPWEDDNEYVFHYSFYPIYCSPNLISVCGTKFQCLASSHGSWSYVGKTFWDIDGAIHELTLDDLFAKKDRQFIFHYCENYFKSNRLGYYCYEDFSWVDFRPDHLDAFVLTENGLLLIFQNYVVSGPDDCPATLLIPYATLAPIANPDGPIPALLQSDDHWMTTKGS